MNMRNFTTLRPLMVADITERYLSWFRDPEVTRYLEASNLTRDEVITHLQQASNGHYQMYAITDTFTGIHIGNLKLGPINSRHGLSDLTTLIGDRDYWGRGYATAAIRKGMDLAWQQDIRKISVGIYSGNIGSLKAYMKAGFVIEARLKGHYVVDGKWQDRVCLSCFANITELPRHLRAGRENE